MRALASVSPHRAPDFCTRDSRRPGGSVHQPRGDAEDEVKYERELRAALRANPLSFIVPKTFIREFPNVVIYGRREKGPLLRDCWVWKLDSDRRVIQFAHAESGRSTTM